MEKTTKKQRKICEVSTNTESKCLKRKIKCRQCQSNTPIKRKSNNFNSKIGACMRNIEKCCICIMQSYAHRTFIIIIIFQDSSQNNRMEFVIRRWICSRGTTTTIAIANIENQIEYSLSYRFLCETTVNAFVFTQTHMCCVSLWCLLMHSIVNMSIQLQMVANGTWEITELCWLYTNSTYILF